jgi:small-conductance mechanosensitive channel
LARLLSPLLTNWLRSRENWPKWRLRLGLQVDRRLTLIVFAAAVMGVVLVMREITWPSRSQVIALAATIATAWVVIFFWRGHRQPLSAPDRQLGGLDLGHDPPAGPDRIGQQGAGRAAISFGDFRLSALTVIKALVVTGLLIAGARLLSQLISARLARNEDISPTMRVLTAKLLQVMLFSMAIIIGLKAVGFDLTGLAVFSGAVGVGWALACKRWSRIWSRGSSSCWTARSSRGT